MNALHCIQACFILIWANSVGYSLGIDRIDTTHTLTSAQILEFLAAESKLADDVKRPIIYADVDGDGIKEIIVAYYTPPHSPFFVAGNENFDFYKRAHVCVLHWNGTHYEEQWDSGGYGGTFRPHLFSVSDVAREAYNENAFNVIDVNGDGVADILATRFTFGTTTASVFEVWEFNGKTYHKIAEMGACQIIKKGMKMELFSNALYAYGDEASETLRWDKNRRRFVEEIKYKTKTGRSPQFFLQNYGPKGTSLFKIEPPSKIDD